MAEGKVQEKLKMKGEFPLPETRTFCDIRKKKRCNNYREKKHCF